MVSVNTRTRVRNTAPATSVTTEKPAAKPGVTSAPAAFETSSRMASSDELKPLKGHKVTLPRGVWNIGTPTPMGTDSVKVQEQAFERMRQSDAPDRTALIAMAITKRSSSPHAYYRGIADVRTAVMASELPVSSYQGKAGFVLSTGDMHLWQPNTMRHASQGVMLAVGDSDRMGFGPYEWDLRSLLVSVELEGRAQKLPAKIRRDAMKSVLREYSVDMARVAGAKNPGKEAKKLRITHDDAPAVLRPLFEKAEKTTHKTFMEAWVDGRSLKRTENLLVDIPDSPKGARARVQKAAGASLPEFTRSLPESERARFDGGRVVDVAIPFKGNGSMGYGRYWVLVEPRGGAKKPEDFLMLEMKEQLQSAIGRVVDQSPTSSMGRDQSERALNLFRLGTGERTAQTWGHVTLPEGCGVESRFFVVKELREDEAGVDLAGISQKGFVEMARAQARILASFQALGGVNGGIDVGGARDIADDIASRPEFFDENLAGALSLADRYEREAARFKAAHQA